MRQTDVEKETENSGAMICSELSSHHRSLCVVHFAQLICTLSPYLALLLN